MKKFAIAGAACLAVVLAAASPALAQGGNRGFHNGGAHFAGGGYRGGGGVGPGLAAGLIATMAAHTSPVADIGAVDFAAGSAPESRLA